MPTITVLCTHDFPCMNVCTEPFYVHKNQCMQILNLLSLTWNSLSSHIFYTHVITTEIFAQTITFLSISRFEQIGSRIQPRPFLKKNGSAFLFCLSFHNIFTGRQGISALKFYFWSIFSIFCSYEVKKSCFWIFSALSCCAVSF